jgi:hypothetical protein
MMDPEWGSLPDRPSPFDVDRATKQLSIEISLSQRAATRVVASGTHRADVMKNNNNNNNKNPF